MIQLLFIVLALILNFGLSQNHLRATNATKDSSLLAKDLLKGETATGYDSERVFIDENFTKRQEISVVQKSDLSLNHTLLIVCKRRNMDKLKQLLLDIANRSSDRFGKHLTQAETKEMIHDPKSIYHVKEFLKEKNLNIDLGRSHDNVIAVTASVQKWQEIFKNEFHEFELTNELYNTSSRIHRALKYSLPKVLSIHIEYIHFLVDFPSILTSKRTETSISKEEASNISYASASFSLNGYVTPQTLFNTYSLSPNTANNLGSQAFFGSLGQVYNPNDLNAFQKVFGLTQIPIAGSLSATPGTTTNCNTNTKNCIEANLDAQYMTMVSPATPTYYAYYADESGFFDWNAWMNTIVSMSNPPLVISISYVSEEPPAYYFNEFNSLAMILAVQGVTLIAASGDNGANKRTSCSYTPLFPASSQYVTTVGATMGPESSKAEVVCSSSSGSSITSGGGFSNNEPMPTWQSSAINNYFDIVNGTTKQPTSGYSTTGRGYPDVSLLGFHYLVVINHAFNVQDGTSASAPVFAGMVAQVNAARLQSGKSSLGWLNPLLYSTYDQGIGNVFNDVTSGQNNCATSTSTVKCTCSEGFSATDGWDPASGLGSINFPNFFSTFSTLDTTPTAEPTFVSNAVPTTEPTVIPTVEPTITPFASPTIEPAALLTNIPFSVYPTRLPTVKRTVSPTTRVPTNVLTTTSLKPSVVRSTVPTVKPRRPPTRQPTVAKVV